MSEKNSNLLYTVFSILFIICALLGSIHFWCYNESFYEAQHNTLTLGNKPINEYIGISNDDLKELTHFTLAYLNDPSRDLDIQMNVNGSVREIFTDDEKAHMVDVRNLNMTANYILIASGVILVSIIVYFVIKGFSSYRLFDSYRKVLLGCLLFFGTLSLWILIDFDSFWTSFHHLFFPGNGLWILDLRKDILIMIVPPQFFNNLVIRIVVTFFILIALMYFVLVYQRKSKTDD
ncbi:MAG: TIGR01906 family membrane protein [Erysipelotrichaceae bacterium]|nr:TIGR01906 family membrane protein [Erysipelotrichaceae bacterium]